MYLPNGIDTLTGLEPVHRGHTASAHVPLDLVLMRFPVAYLNHSKARQNPEFEDA